MKLKIKFGKETVEVKMSRFASDREVQNAIERESRKRNTLPDYVNICR